MSGQIIDILLLERNYRVMCPQGQENALQEAAQRLNERLLDTKAITKLTNVEQIAVMTALNICNEWTQEKASTQEKITALEEKIKLLQATIKKAISEAK